MMYSKRRNYQSSSYNSPKIVLNQIYSLNERDTCSAKYSRPKTRVAKLGNQNIQTKFSQFSEAPRPRSKGSMMKTKHQYKISTRIRTQCQDEIEKQNRSIRIRQKPINYSMHPLKQQPQYRLSSDKNEFDLLRYYKFSVGGHKGKGNQDRVFCGQNCYVICDGHGPQGGTVSSFVGQKLLNYSIINKQQNSVSQSSISKIFENTKDDLEQDNDLDLDISGSTAIVVQIVNNKIYCANSGDCRAVMSKKGTAIELNNQHKPDKPKQRQRIYRMGGTIRKNGNGPYRLYNPERKYGVGGLSVSRGFGDKALTSWGLTHQPEIMKFDIEYGTDFIVMGSDGFFEFFSPSDVVSFTYKLLRNGSMNLAEELVEQATKRWVGFYETDDISCIVILF